MGPNVKLTKSCTFYNRQESSWTETNDTFLAKRQIGNRDKK